VNERPSPASATSGGANQPPPLAGYNAWSQDRILRPAVEREGGSWIAERAQDMGGLVGSERLQTLATQANRYPPELKTHDRFGNRIDAVEYHPAYHELMALAFGAGLHSLAWTEKRQGAWVARAALNYLWNQGEQGISCPVTMTFAGVKILRNAPALSAQWEPKLTAKTYDPRPLPVAQKAGATIGMAMTEKQGGSDVRANTTRAESGAGGTWRITGHKWFLSAPMCDAWLVLAQSPGGLSCFFLPRFTPDGVPNAMRIQRLKDKLGNRSNASSEVEFQGAWATLLGEQGRGVPMILEMGVYTRLDCAIGTAGLMRQAQSQALWNAAQRQAFGKLLKDQPLMKNVLADLALESEAATALVLRLCT